MNNDDVIEVDKTAEIPSDYDDVIGVPLSFLDKYNSQQFEIINVLNRYPLFDEDDFIINRDENKVGKHMCSINNGTRFTYFRIVIIRRYKQLMKIKLHEITVQELVADYQDHQENGVFGYGGRLNIRPS